MSSRCEMGTSREGEGRVSGSLGWSRTLSDVLGLLTLSYTAVLYPQAPVGLISPYLKSGSSPHISSYLPPSPRRCRSGSSRPAGEGRRSRSGCRRRQTRRATKAAGAVQRDDDYKQLLIATSLTHRQLERRPLQRDDRAVCGWPHGPSPRDHKSV